MAIPINPNGTINFDRVFNVYKGAEAKPVHNQKEYDAAVMAGFGAYIPLEYPRRLYNEDGVSRDVADADAEKEAAGEGFLRGRTHVKVVAPVVAAQPAAFVPHNDFSGAIQALEKRSDEQGARLAGIENALQSIIDTLDHPKRKKGD